MEDRELRFDATPAFEITKAYNGASGEMFVEGVASTTGIDLTKERMSPEAIAKMAARAIGIPLRSEHGKGWDDKLGEIVQADVIKDNAGSPALWIKARLYDWSSKAKDLFTLLKSGSKLGLSVAGRIRQGGIVKELVESIGKYVPTYHDVELTEVSVTDHPANLNTFAVAVAKSFLAEEVYNPDEYAKAARYPEVDTGDFLDAENRTYPADDKHLMPALKYFNHSGQRSAGGYSSAKWATMGKQLAAKVSRKTGEPYAYDPDSEKVVKQETKKESREEVNEMNRKDSNLVSKQVSPAVASFAKEWGRDITKEVAVEKVTDGEEATVQKDHDSSSTSTTSTDSTIESLLSDIASSLTDLKSSMSSTSSSSDSSSTDSSTSSGSSTSTDKAADGEEEEDELGKAVQSFEFALQAMKKAMGKKKVKPVEASSYSSSGNVSGKPESSASTAKAKKPTGGQVGASDYSTSDNVTGKPASSADTTTTKAIKELAEAVQALAKSQAEMKKSIDETPRPRKGYALMVEKQFQGHTDVQEGGYSKDILDKLVADKRSNFNDVHMYKTDQRLPSWFEQN